MKLVKLVKLVTTWSVRLLIAAYFLGCMYWYFDIDRFDTLVAENMLYGWFMPGMAFIGLIGGFILVGIVGGALQLIIYAFNGFK